MKTNLAVFFGGRSTEHEISVISANQAMHAADTEKYNIIPIYISKEGQWYTGDSLMDISNYRDMNALLAKCTPVFMHGIYGDSKLYTIRKSLLGSKNAVVADIDVALPILHGSNGEDGTFQGLMQTIGLPFAGCDVLSSANGMDKITMKMILQASGIPVVNYVWFNDREWYLERDAVIERIEKNIGYPAIVKPANLGSSVGIARANNREELIEKIEEADRYSIRIIVEHLVEDLQEINCAVLGDNGDYSTSVLEEPVKSGEILSYKDKYMGGGKSAKGMQAAQKRIPAELPKEVTERISYLAGETFRVLGCSGVSRVDVIVDRKDGAIYVNEINTIPGSLSFYLWEAAGLKFDELIDKLVALALKRKREADRKTVSYSQNIFALGGGVKGTKGAKS